MVGLPTASGGKRYLPDVSLFAANGVWGHFYVYCMSDATEGGVACNYTNTTDTLDLAAGGTSFASPALAGIQAIVNQKTGSSQGNPNYTYYKLAAAEFGASGSSACNSDQGAPASPSLPASSCIFNDVTAGDMDVPCTGTTNCYGYSKSNRKTYYGALSSSSTSFEPAYPAGTGWDYATGLGTVNAYNLVTNWPVPYDGGLRVATAGSGESAVTSGVAARLAVAVACLGCGVASSLGAGDPPSGRPRSIASASSAVQSELTASDGAFEAGFGYAVAVSGDVAVGAYHATVGDGGEQGAAYIFVNTAAGWTQELQRR